MYYLLYGHIDRDIRDNFLKISNHFPKNLQKLSEVDTNISEQFPKITEDFQRWLPVANHPKMKKCIYIGESIKNLYPRLFFFGYQELTKSLKVPISSKFLFSYLILYFMQWSSAKKIFDLDNKQFFNEFLKTWKSYFLAVHLCRWSQHRHAQSCDIDSGTCDFRLDLSRLFYLYKFSFVVHAKCSFPAFCMNY